MHCQSCGKEVDSDGDFCSSCGAELTTSTAESDTDNAPLNPLIHRVGFGVVFLLIPFGAAYATVDAALGGAAVAAGVAILLFNLYSLRNHKHVFLDSFAGSYLTNTQSGLLGLLLGIAIFILLGLLSYRNTDAEILDPEMSDPLLAMSLGILLIFYSLMTLLFSRAQK